MLRRHVWGRMAIALTSITIAGCAGTHLAQPTQPRNGNRITSATITWDESLASSVPVRLHKAAAAMGYVPPAPSISDRDQAQARARAKAVWVSYRDNAVPLLRRALAAEGVQEGAQTRIVLRPSAISIDANNGAVNVAVQVSVIQPDTQSPWSITAISNNMADGAYWNVLRPAGIGDTVDVDLTKLVDSFARTTATQMRLAGWFFN